MQRGDCLWTIAETHLGSGFRWTEIYDLNRDLITDPDLIDIGWTLTLPTDTALAPTTSVTESTPPRPNPSPTTIQPSGPAIAPAPHPTTTTSAPKTAPGPSTKHAPGHRKPVERARREPVAPRRDIGATLLEGTGVVAATGLLLAALAARRRRLARGVAPAAASALESSLLRSADVPLIRWAGQQLAQLVGGLPTGFDAIPVAVELSEEDGIEVLWDQAASGAPSPWQAIGGGWSWTCGYDPDQPVPDDELPAPLPALVTIGQRDDRQVMINLEAFGSVSVVGDRRRSEDFVRSLVVELGGGDDLADAYVYVESGTPDLRFGSSLSRVRGVSSEQLVTQLACARSTTQDQLSGAAAATTIDYRAGRADRPPIEATVAVSAATDDTAALLAQVGPGASAVVLGQADTSATVILDASGTGRLEPLGVTFTAVGLSAEVDAALAELLTDDPPPDVRHERTSRLMPTGPALRPASTLPLTRPGRIEPPSTLEAPSATAIVEPRLLVKVLGKPGVVDRPELSRRELMVVVYMACAGRPVHNDDIRDAIWGGEPISAKSAYNLVARARSKLGLWDGTPILAKPVPPHNTLALADGVTTDLALLRALTAAAAQQNPQEALATIGRALALIDGAPFDAPGYEWAHLSLLAADASTAIEETVLAGVRLSIGADDPGAAQAALVTGLRALPEHDAFLAELERTSRDLRPPVGAASRVRSSGS